MEPQSAVTPGEELIRDLEELRSQLSALEERLENSGVSRTNGLRQSMGRDCTFYRKSLDIFLRKDYKDVKELVSRVKELFDLVEGNRDGNT